MRRAKRALAIITALVTIWTQSASALPEVEEVVSGDVQLNRPDPQTLQINATNNSIINYTSFNINANESVIVTLPSQESQILNRVTGPEMSTILGRLESNGTFILINPAGINVGPQANIQAQNLVLSTRDIANTNFINREYIFEALARAGKEGFILNEGAISIQQAGFCAFIAGAVENRGIIAAKMGTVALAAGDVVALEVSQDGLISVAIDEAVSSRIVDAEGNPVSDQIKNTGELKAQGGAVILAAESLPGIFAHAINLEGVTDGTRFEASGGTIRVVADREVLINGDVAATSVEIGSQRVSPEKVLMGKGARLAGEDSVTITSGGFGTYEEPLRIASDNIYIRRPDGTFEIRESSLAGTDLFLRGPAGGWGSVSLNRTARLTIEADKVLLTGGDPAYFYGDVTFYNFECKVPGKEIYFEAGKTFTFKGGLNMGIDEPNWPVYLRSTVKGERWNINVETADYILRRLSVEDSYNIGSGALRAHPALNMGNNINWNLNTLVGNAASWSGAGGDTNWSTLTNWDPYVMSLADLQGQSIEFTSGTGNSVVDADFGVSIGSLTINGFTGTITLAKNLSVTGNFSQSSGTIRNVAGGDYTISVRGDVTGGALGRWLSGTLEFNGSQDQKWTPGSVEWYNVTVNAASAAMGPQTVTVLGATADIRNNFTLSQGQFIAPRVMNVGGNFSHSYLYATFTHNSGTVVFDNPNKVSEITGDTTFYNFKCTTAGKTLKFQAGSTQTIESELALTGASGNLITLARLVPQGCMETEWKINPRGTRDVSYVDVSYSNNLASSKINASDSTDNGQNTNWLFSVGAGGTTNSTSNTPQPPEPPEPPPPPASNDTRTSGGEVQMGGGETNTGSSDRPAGEGGSGGVVAMRDEAPGDNVGSSGGTPPTSEEAPPKSEGGPSRSSKERQGPGRSDEAKSKEGRGGEVKPKEEKPSEEKAAEGKAREDKKAEEKKLAEDKKGPAKEEKKSEKDEKGPAKEEKKSEKEEKKSEKEKEKKEGEEKRSGEEAASKEGGAEKDYFSGDIGGKYEKHYEPGTYRTSVIVYEGSVVAAPYDESGPAFDKGSVLTMGQEFSQTGEVL